MIYLRNGLAKLIEKRLEAMYEYGDGLTCKQRDRCLTMGDIWKKAKVCQYSSEDANMASGAWSALNFARLHKNVTVVEMDCNADGDVIVFAMKPDAAKKLILSLDKDN